MNQQECLHKHEESPEELSVLAESPAAEGLPVVAPLDGFTAEEAERLVRFKRLVERGERSDAYPLDRRQDFVRWLVSQGKLSDN